jgi:hypothetical protein
MAKRRKARGCLSATPPGLPGRRRRHGRLNPAPVSRAAIPASFAVIETVNGEIRISLYRKGGPRGWQIFSEAYLKDKPAQPFYP